MDLAYLIVSSTLGPNIVVSLRPQNAIITIEVQLGDKNNLIARDPLKLLGQIHYVSERKASYRSRGYSHVREE